MNAEDEEIELIYMARASMIEFLGGFFGKYDTDDVIYGAYQLVAMKYGYGMVPDN